MYATNILESTNDELPPIAVTFDVATFDVATFDVSTFDVATSDIRTDIDTNIDDEFDEFVLDELLDGDTDTPVTPRLPQARCADGHGTLTHLFFSDVPLDTARAKAICGKCALAPSCLQGALERAEPWGVWGGELIENGRVVLNKRPRGRPPKHPRPVLLIDEVPIPPHLVA